MIDPAVLLIQLNERYFATGSVLREPNRAERRAEARLYAKVTGTPIYETPALPECEERDDEGRKCRHLLDHGGSCATWTDETPPGQYANQWWRKGKGPK